MPVAATEEAPGLRARAVRASGWVLIGRILSRAVTFATSLILARLLTPEDFGFVAMGLLTISLLEVVTAVGVRDALIQREGDVRAYLDSAWTLEVVRGGLITGLVCLAAPGLAAFFRQPDAVGVIRAVSIIPLLKGLENIGTVLFRKELTFRREFALEATRTITTGIVGLTLALVYRNVWALVAAYVVGQAVQSIASYRLSAVRPAFRIDMARARTLYGFGKWVFLGGLVGYAQLQADTFYVGRFFSTTELGLYTLAFTISNIVVVDIGKTLARVMFPVYALRASDLEKASRGLLDTFELVAGAIVPVCAGLALVADDFTRTLLGERWVGMIPVLGVLGIAACFRALAVAGSGFFWGIGRPQVTFRMNLLQLLVLGIGLVVLPGRFGLTGVAAAFGLGYSFYVMQFVHETVMRCSLKAADWAGKLAPLAVQLLVMIAVVLAIRQLLPPGALRLGTAVIGGASAYFGAGVVLLKLLKRGQLQTMATLGYGLGFIGRLSGRT